MSVVKISALTIAPEHHEEFARRYRTPPSEAPDAPGFEGSDVLVPDDGTARCLVIMRWRSQEDFLAWTQSADFAARHERHRQGEPIELERQIWSYVSID